MSEKRRELPAGWEWSVLGEICEINPREHNNDLDDRTSATFVPMSAVDEKRGEIVDRMSRPLAEVRKGFTRFREGDVLFAKITPCMENGKAAIARGLENGLGFGTTEFHVLRPLGGIPPEYVFHFVRQQSYRARAAARMTGTAGQLRVPKDFLAQSPIPLPPVLEQRRIVSKIESFLLKVMASRERLTRARIKLEEFRRAVLVSGCSGKLTKKWRQATLGEPLDKMLGRVRVAQSSTGRHATKVVIPGRCALSVGFPNLATPAGWQWVPLLQVARLETGHTPSRKRKEYWDGMIPWIGIQDARRYHGGRITQTRKHVSDIGLENSSARLLPANTVCLSRTASVGHVVIMDRPMATSQDFVNWICSDALLPEFLMYAIMAEGDGLRNFGKGTTHTTIYFPEVKAFHICLPPIDEQREVVRRVSALLQFSGDIRRHVDIAAESMDRLPDAVLNKAFHGDLVKQESAAEPASVLLARIRSQREMELRSPIRRANLPAG